MSKKALKIIPFIILFSLLNTLIGCSSPKITPTSIQIKRLVFLNQSSKTLNNVRIYVTKTHEFASCGHILPKTECSTGFPLREYQGNSFDISWSENGQNKSRHNIQAVVPVNINTEKPANAVITFGENEYFTASLIQ